MVKPQQTSSNIWTCATHGDVLSVQRIVEQEGEDVDAQNKLGESAAHLAARGGHVGRDAC
jgi:ankyrin repeat protein